MEAFSRRSVIQKESIPGLIQGHDGAVHVLVWTDRVTTHNLDRSMAFALDLISKHPDGIVAVNVVAHGLGLPDGDAHRRANEVSRALDAHVLATAVVLPGEGFWVSASRAFLTGLNMMSPLKGKRVIARTVEEGFRYAAPRVGRSAPWAVQCAKIVEDWTR
jgi:hypothetical protein